MSFWAFAPSSRVSSQESSFYQFVQRSPSVKPRSNTLSDPTAFVLWIIEMQDGLSFYIIINGLIFLIEGGGSFHGNGKVFLPIGHIRPIFLNCPNDKVWSNSFQCRMYHRLFRPKVLMSRSYHGGIFVWSSQGLANHCCSVLEFRSSCSLTSFGYIWFKMSLQMLPICPNATKNSPGLLYCVRS